MKNKDTIPRPGEIVKPPAEPASDPAPAPASPAPAAEPPPSAEVLEARARDVIASMFPKPGASDPKPFDAVAPPAPTPESAADPAPEPPSVVKPMPPPIEKAIDPELLKEHATPVTPPVTPPEPELSRADQKTLKIIERMESQGTAEKGTIERTKKFWALEAAYISKWEEENPGCKWNKEDEEHAKFYEAEPVVDPEEYEETKDKLKREEDWAAYDAKRQMEELRTRVIDQVPKTEAAVADAVVKMVCQAGFEKIITRDGKPVVTKETQAAIKEANPYAVDILEQEAEVVSIQIQEIDRLQAFPGIYDLDPKTSVRKKDGEHILVHMMIRDQALATDKEIASLPPEKTMRDGRRYVTNDQWLAAVASINNSKASDSAKQIARAKLADNYYSMDWEDVKISLIAKHAARAALQIERSGGIRGQKVEPGAAPDDHRLIPPFQQAARPSGKAPSVSSASDMVDTGQKRPGTSEKSKDDIVRSMWP